MRARLLGEDVHDEIDIIQQHPLRPVVAFHIVRVVAVALEAQLDVVGDRLDLPRVGAGADQEIIGETGDLSQVENYQIQGFLR